MAVATVSLIALAVKLAIDEADVDPNDSGWAEVAFFLSPILAIAVSVVIGILLVVIAGLRMVRVDVSRAFRAMIVGVFLGPIAYNALLIILAGPLDAAHSGLAAAMVTFVLPTIVGIGVTLAAAVMRLPKRSSRGERGPTVEP